VFAPLPVDCRQQPAANANGAQTSVRATASQRRSLFRASVGSTLRGDGDLFVVRRDPGFGHGLLLSIRVQGPASGFMQSPLEHT
jgi:hypothetical protein